MESLPSELMLEILSRTALESLEECKSVCKDWKEIIYEPSFIHLHSERSNSILGYFIQGLKEHSEYPWAFISATASSAAAIKSTWPSNDIRILASSDQGILICERRVLYNRRFYACKPSTGQWQALPNPKFRYQTAALAVVVLQSQPLRYLIARLYRSGMQDHCEIFDSEIWRWEKMDCAPPYGDNVIDCDPPITTAGRFVHWLTFNNKVVTLDVENRCFESWALPERVRCNEKRLVEYDGRLGLMCRVQDLQGDRSVMELWANREKKMVVDIKHILDHPTPEHLCNNNIVFMSNVDGGGFYNPLNSSFTKVEVPDDLKYPHKFDQIFLFKSDMNVVDLKPARYVSTTNKIGLPSGSKTT